MNDDEIAQLQNEDEWDFEHAERARAPRSRRAIVSVGFRPTEFAVVAAAAERRDQPVSQFIRQAALDRARGHAAETFIAQPLTIAVSAVPVDVESWMLNALRRHGRMSSLR